MAEREYYYHLRTGDKGYKVMIDGKPHIQRDLGNLTVEQTGIHPVPFNDREWLIERESRPLTKVARAEIAFSADRTACRALGLHNEARKKWIDLHDEERIEFMERGPIKGKAKNLQDALRNIIFASLMHATKDFAET